MARLYRPRKEVLDGYTSFLKRSPSVELLSIFRKLKNICPQIGHTTKKSRDRHDRM